MERVEYFSIYELYFLLDSFGGSLLLGLPSRNDLTISSESIWLEAKEALTDKHIVDEVGALTETGFVITEVLREYCLGESLTVLNNVYIMYSSETKSSVVIVDTMQGYQLLKLSPLSLLSFLQAKFPLMLREAPSDETTFLKKEVELTEAFERILIGHDVVVLQHYPLSSLSDSQYSEEFSQLLLVEYEDELFGYDVKQGELFQYSQYYFLERIYTWLSIPFREEDFAKWHKS